MMTRTLEYIGTGYKLGLIFILIHIHEHYCMCHVSLGENPGSAVRFMCGPVFSVLV